MVFGYITPLKKILYDRTMNGIAEEVLLMKSLFLAQGRYTTTAI